MDFTENVVFAVLFSTVLVFNVAGNTLVIYIISTNKVRNSATNYLLLNMAVADLVLGLFAVPEYIASPSYSKQTQHVLECKYLNLTNISWLAAAASSITMVALSIERYYAVCQPLKFRRLFSIRNTKAMIAVSWIYGVLTNIYSFIFNDCTNGTLSQNVRKAFSTLFFIEGFLFLSIMSYLVSKTSRVLWANRLVLGRFPYQPAQLVRYKKRRKVTRAALLVIVTFIICWIPEKLACLSTAIVDGHNEVVSYALSISAFLVSVNACLDPYLFSFQGTCFRVYLKRLICCCVPRQKIMRFNRNQVHIMHFNRNQIHIEMPKY